MEISFSPAALEKMNVLRLSAESVAECVRACEAEGLVVLEEGTGRRFCHRTAGCATLWAESSPAEDGWRVESVYSHRLVIEEDR